MSVHLKNRPDTNCSARGDFLAQHARDGLRTAKAIIAIVHQVQGFVLKTGLTSSICVALRKRLGRAAPAPPVVLLCLNVDALRTGMDPDCETVRRGATSKVTSASPCSARFPIAYIRLNSGVTPQGNGCQFNKVKWCQFNI